MNSNRLTSENVSETGVVRAFFGTISTWFKLLLLVVGLACVLAAAWAIYCRVQLKIGRNEWTRAKSELEAKGEKLDWASFVPRSVPDDQNFIRTLVLEGMGYRDNYAPALKRKFDSHGAGLLVRLLPDLETGKPAEIPAMARVVRSNSWPVPTEPITNAAATVIEWFQPLETEFNELREASLKPYALWRVSSTNGFDGPLPNFVFIRELSQQLAALATAELANGAPDRALADTRVNLKLAGSLADHSTLVAMMIGTSLDQLSMSIVWQGLEDRRWNGSQLTELDGLLQPIDLPAAFQRVMRSERASVNQVFATADAAQNLARFGGISTTVSRYTHGRFPPEGWMLQSLAEYDQAIQRFIVDIYDSDRDRVLTERTAEMREFIAQLDQSGSRRHWITRVAMPNFQKAMVVASRAQTYVNEARLAVALERYRIQNGELPESLSALVPAFMKVLPHDLFGGNALHYRKSDHAGYTLWSVGWNGVDENGKKSESREDGDWVWTGK